MSTTSTQTGEIVVQGKRLIDYDRAAAMLGLKPASLSTGISRGQYALTRYFAGRRPRFDVAEIEKLILSKSTPAGQRRRKF
ncbi:MAG: hypothetical protein RJA59_1276 [Pseudomonadota bacterium]